jgi:tetraacyldisaccharide 4'-kinase
VLSDRVRAFWGERLAAGDTSTAARALAAIWARAANVARPLHLPAGTAVIAVGSAVLGGAGKTPLAIALCRALPGAALIGHGYRARPGRARVVAPGDPLALVGDDALTAARLLPGTTVVVGPRREAAIAHAAALGHRVQVVDGLLQAAPIRVALSILVLDATAPWGSGACPPAGDLRAPREALLDAADVVAAILPAGATLPEELAALGAIAVPSRIESAGGRPLGALVGLRLGLLSTVARPARVLDALASAGLRPAVTLRFGDHASPDLGRSAGGRVAGHRVDAWLATARCAVRLPAEVAGAPVLPLEHRLDVPALLCNRAERAATVLG